MADLTQLQKLPTLPPDQYYIYAIENISCDGSNKKLIKIGITHNPHQRFNSLSGSNGGGSKINRFVVSPKTYLYSIEETLHNHFAWYRIEGTEWFKDITLEEVGRYMKQLFSSAGYKTCNELRKSIVEKKLAEQKEDSGKIKEI